MFVEVDHDLPSTLHEFIHFSTCGDLLIGFLPMHIGGCLSGNYFLDFGS